MWQAWFNGVLGLWIMLVAFLGFSSTLTRAILILTGLAAAIFGFWTSSLTKPFTNIKNRESEILPEKQDYQSSDNKNYSSTSANENVSESKEEPPPAL